MKYNSLYCTIEKAIEYIEENIKRTITLEEISKDVNLSMFYLDRLFHEISKTTLMRYVKNRKLSSSIGELLNTNLKISDIAEEYGFNYEQSYIRLFENTFTISPDRFRKEKPILKITDKINLKYIRLMGEEGIVFDPHIVIKPEFFITGIRHKINKEYDQQFHEANIKGNDFYYTRRHEIENTLYSNIYIGFVDLVTSDSSFTYYMPSVQVSDPGNTIPAGMVCQRVPTNKYAVFKYIGLHHARQTNINNLYNTLRYIYEEWFPKSGYSQSAPYHFERYDDTISRDDYCEFEIYIPVSNNS